MNEKQLIHVSKKATYFRYSNGIVEKVYHGKDQTSPKTKKVSVSNDAEGHALIKFLKPFGIRGFKFRCPNDGGKYPQYTLEKKRAKVIDIYFKN
jgi:hypothetical protein